MLLFKRVSFVDPQDGQNVDLEVLINRLEEGAFFGEEVLYEELDSRYMYTARVHSLDCRLLAFEKGSNSKDFSTLLLAQSLKKALRLKMSCRNELLAKILAQDVEKLKTCYGSQQTGLQAADAESHTQLSNCAVCRNKHEKLDRILTREIPRALLRFGAHPKNKQASTELPAISSGQTQAPVRTFRELQASRLFALKHVGLHKKQLSAELSSVVLKQPSKYLSSDIITSRKTSDDRESSQRGLEPAILSESLRGILPGISASRLDKKPAEAHPSSKHASSKSYGMGSIDTLSTINRQLKAKSLSKSHPSILPDNKSCFNVCAIPSKRSFQFFM